MAAARRHPAGAPREVVVCRRLSSSGEASWRAHRPTKQCAKSSCWFPRHVHRTFLAGVVLL
eukprot:8974367-Pyramimonas_sp.AAC.1